MRFTFIGDVHGCFQTMLALLKKIPKENNRIIFMGDLINKGSRSYAVYHYIRKNKMVCLLGNHEYYCINRHKQPYKTLWKTHGGEETERSIAKSLDTKSDKKIENTLDRMAAFFDGFPKGLLLPTSGKVDILATHAGLSCSHYEQKKIKRAVSAGTFSGDLSCLFHKEDLAQIPRLLQVIGHRPTAYAPLQRHTHYFTDSGCVYKNKRGMGYLSALMLDPKKPSETLVFRQPNLDD